MKKFAIVFFLLASTKMGSGKPFRNFDHCKAAKGVNGEIDCGVITIPEDHTMPEGKKIQLSYIIFKSLDKSSRAYPMIFLSGGPGGASLTAASIEGWSKHPFRKNRDIIIFDQRGIGYSSELPNMNNELRELLAKDLNNEEEQTMIRSLVIQYANKCSEQDINLENYNTYQNAYDVGLLMKHLNYKSYNLYGVSYGTRLARVIQELYPEYLNAVILNSPNPIKGDFILDRLNSYSLALSRIFEYCKESVDCYNDHPNLKENYLTALTNIKEQPLILDNGNYRYCINVQDAIYFLRRALYRTDSRTIIPALIQEYLEGGGPIIENMVKSEFSPGFNFSMWLSVERYEQFSAENTNLIINSRYQSLPLLPYRMGLFTSLYLAMEDFHGGSLSDDKKEANKSDVPTLIFVNQFDPVTPPENGHVLMKGLTKGQLFILNEGGHGGGSMTCKNQLMAAFMNSPDLALDSSCLNIYR